MMNKPPQEFERVNQNLSFGGDFHLRIEVDLVYIYFLYARKGLRLEENSCTLYKINMSLLNNDKINYSCSLFYVCR